MGRECSEHLMALEQEPDLAAAASGVDNPYQNRLQSQAQRGDLSGSPSLRRGLPLEIGALVGVFDGANGEGSPTLL